MNLSEREREKERERDYILNLRCILPMEKLFGKNYLKCLGPRTKREREREREWGMKRDVLVHD